MRVTRRRNLLARIRRRDGVATVEMALVAPFVFLMIFTWFEFARMIMVRQALTNACREACRHATLATTRSDADAEAFLEQKLQAVVCGNQDCADIIDADITPSFANTTLTSGTEITTSVEVQCSDVSWLPPMFFGGTALKATATMVRE